MLRGELAGGVRFAFTDRLGGVSAAPYNSLNLGSGVGDDPAAVAENRRRMARMAGLAPERTAFMSQVHGRAATVVDGPTSAPVPDSDGLVTAAPDLGVVVLAADCVPVLLSDPEVGVVAAVHAGRRGVQAGVVVRAVEVMAQLGAQTARMSARIGPAICGRCYEVPAGMQEEVCQVAPAARATTWAGTPGLDLRAGLVGVLGDLGVPDVDVLGSCTREDSRLYSYRRDGRTGRLAGVIWCEAPGGPA